MNEYDTLIEDMRNINVPKVDDNSEISPDLGGLIIYPLMVITVIGLYLHMFLLPFLMLEKMPNTPITKGEHQKECIFNK